MSKHLPLLAFICLIFFSAGYAQPRLKEGFASGALGYSRHGTGDMPGVAFMAEMGRDLGRHTEWAVNLKATINGDAETVLLTDPQGNQADRFFRYNNVPGIFFQNIRCRFRPCLNRPYRNREKKVFF